MHRQTGVRDRLRDSVADSARRVVILDRDQAALRRTRCRHEGSAIYRRDRVQVDDTNRRAGRFQLIVRLERFEHRHAGANHGGDVVRAFAQNLEAAHREDLVG